MKYASPFAVIVLAFLSMWFGASAQDEQIDKLKQLNFDTEELKEIKDPYFSIGLGYSGSFLMLKYDDMNKFVTGKLGIEKASGPMFVNGIHGFSGIIIVPNLKFGILGLSGSKKMEGSLDVNGTKVNRHLDFDLNLTGFTFDYAWVPVKSLAVTIGTALGWGSLSIESYQNAGEISWNDLGTKPVGLNYSDKLTKSIVFAEPALNLEYALTKFFMLKAGVSYNITADNFFTSADWKLNKNTDVTGVPSGINGNGLSIKFGAYVGVFNY